MTKYNADSLLAISLADAFSATNCPDIQLGCLDIEPGTYEIIDNLVLPANIKHIHNIHMILTRSADVTAKEQKLLEEGSDEETSKLKQLVQLEDDKRCINILKQGLLKELVDNVDRFIYDFEILPDWKVGKKLIDSTAKVSNVELADQISERLGQNERATTLRSRIVWPLNNYQ